MQQSARFKTKLEEVLSDSYSPKDEDIVKCRAMTSSVSDTSFTFNNKREQIIPCLFLFTQSSDYLSFVNTTIYQYELRWILTKASLCDAEFVLRDVGGQVQYRNQWKEAFLGAQCVLYIVSLDDFHKESSNVIINFPIAFSSF